MVKIGKLLSEAFSEDLPKKVLEHEQIAIMFATSYQTSEFLLKSFVLSCHKIDSNGNT